MYIRFTKSVHLHYRTRVFTLSNTHIRPPFRVYFPICGHDKSDPYGCWRSAITLRTVCNNATPTHKNHTFVLQKPTSRTTNTHFLQRKNPLFATQKPICDKLGGSQKRFVKIIIVAETNISHTQNKTLSSLLEYHFLNHYNRLYRVRITIWYTIYNDFYIRQIWNLSATD